MKPKVNANHSLSAFILEGYLYCFPVMTLPGTIQDVQEESPGCATGLGRRPEDPAAKSAERASLVDDGDMEVVYSEQLGDHLTVHILFNRP